MLLVGCEPVSVDYGIGLSPVVTAAVGEAVRVVKDLIAAAGSDAGEQHPVHDDEREVSDGQRAGNDGSR